MSELWAVGLATAAVGAGASVYSANKQASATKKAAEIGANAAAANGNGHLKLPAVPEYQKFDYWGLNPQVVAADKYAYAESDADFRRRHKDIVKAERLFEDSVLADQKGEHELMPAVQNEFMRAGMTNALGSFNAPFSLAPGSAGEADVARNLGLSILGFQDRNRRNRMDSLRMAEEIFPRRAFGMSGADLASALVAKNVADNQVAQQQHSQDIEQIKYNSGIDIGNNAAATNQANLNAQANAEASAAQAKALAEGITGVVGAAGSAYGQYKGGQTNVANAVAPSRIVSTPTGSPAASSYKYTPGTTGGWKAA